MELAEDDSPASAAFAAPAITVGVEPEYVTTNDLDEAGVKRPIPAPSDAIESLRVRFEALELVRRMGLVVSPAARTRRPRSWVEKSYPDVVYFNEVDRGGLRDLGRAGALRRRDGGHPASSYSVEAQDRFLDLLTASVCEVAIDADASEPSVLEDSKRPAVVRGRSGVQWTLGNLAKKNLECRARDAFSPLRSVYQKVTSG